MASPDLESNRFEVSVDLSGPIRANRFSLRKKKTLIFQGKTLRVDSACADCQCPGFLVLGAAPAPASTFVSEPQIVPLGYAQHMFLQHRRAHTDILRIDLPENG